MLFGEFLTKATVWLAVIAYTAGTVQMLFARHRGARLAWTLGCAFFLAHVACAFGFYHHWSHAAAYADTARQTQTMTGLNWGGGLYLNDLFAAAWFAEVLWWWTSSTSFLRRPAWLVRTWHGFYFFMIVNGTIVFGHGPARWLGAMVVVALTIAVTLRARGSLPTGRYPAPPDPSPPRARRFDDPL